MQKLYSYDITFDEVPDKVSLTLAFSGCNNNCKGCHSPWLQSNEGEEFNARVFLGLFENYKDSIDVVTFLGGENHCTSFLVEYCHLNNVEVCIYTGEEYYECGSHVRASPLVDYVKTGPYIEELGPLTSPTTNQRMFYHGEEIKFYNKD